VGVGCVGPSRGKGRSDFWSCSSSFSFFGVGLLFAFFACGVGFAFAFAFRLMEFLIFVWHDTFSFSFYSATTNG
jgi:hypothetical protein